MSSQLGSSKNQACVSDLLLLYAPVARVTLALYLVQQKHTEYQNLAQVPFKERRDVFGHREIWQYLI